MKILEQVLKFIGINLTIAFTALCVAVVSGIFMPENLKIVLELLKGVL